MEMNFFLKKEPSGCSEEWERMEDAIAVVFCHVWNVFCKHTNLWKSHRSVCLYFSTGVLIMFIGLKSFPFISALWCTHCTWYPFS